jgi:hypothetical protein
MRSRAATGPDQSLSVAPAPVAWSFTPAGHARSPSLAWAWALLLGGVVYAASGAASLVRTLASADVPAAAGPAVAEPGAVGIPTVEQAELLSPR